ncbi:sensor histidine kinase, partial [Singulisphaera rosea]
MARMSDAASSISASNLSRRIDMARTESELGRLATILNETFDRLEGAFVRQVQFTADASHELRTPLSVVISHCELALRKSRTPEEYREMFATALKAAKRMRGVIEGLLTLARADSTAPNLDHGPVDLAEVVEESVEMLRPLASSSKVEIEIETEPAEAFGDHDRLRELVVNLVTNAIRYNREDGRVTVRLRKEPEGLTLTVADSGIGIPEEHWPELFERFYRVDPVRSRELGGSGLGLSIARWIVEAHGGTITFTSVFGEGTTFTVHLPAAKPRLEPDD